MVLGIYGSGGAGKIVKDIAVEQNQWEEVVFIDDTVSADVYKGVRRMPFSILCEEFRVNEIEIIIALGEPKYKIMIYDKIKKAGYNLGNVIHRTALVSKEAVLGKGVFINAGAVISADAVIEDNVSIEEYSIVSHESIVHAHAQISAFVMISGHCEVGEGTYIGVNVPVKEKVKIGAHSVVGMGSVVLRDIPDGVTAMGNPAKAMLKRAEEDRVFK